MEKDMPVAVGSSIDARQELINLDLPSNSYYYVSRHFPVYVWSSIVYYRSRMPDANNTIGT